MVELKCAHLSVDVEKEVGRHKLDLVVENQIILELKTVEELSKARYAQVRSYLKATGLSTAFLVNFSNKRSDFRRIDASDKSLSKSPLSPPFP